MWLPYLLMFCRIVIGLTFLVSLLGKLGQLAAFRQTIARFQLLPARLIGAAAVGLLALEAAVVLLMVAGGALLWAGFALAVALLVAFSAALASLLARKIRTSCNCFGPSTRSASVYDIWRNAGLIVCALAGCGALAAGGAQARLALAEWALIGVMAAVFVAVWVQISEIAQLFRQS